MASPKRRQGKPPPDETPERWRTCARTSPRLHRGGLWVDPAAECNRISRGEHSAPEAVALHLDRQAVARQAEHPGGLRLVAVRAPQRLADRRLLGVADHSPEIEIG